MDTNRSCLLKLGITFLILGGSFYIYLKLRRSVFRKSFKGNKQFLYYRPRPQGLKEYKYDKTFIQEQHIGYVSKIICYPLTSCAGINEKSAWCSHLGLRMFKFTDREYIVCKVYDPTSTVQYQSPKLKDMTVNISGQNLCLKYMNNYELKMTSERRKDSQGYTIQCLGMEIDGIDCGNKASAWLNECLQETNLKLFDCKNEWAIESMRFKSVGCLLATLSSLEEINDIFMLTTPLTVELFRPNIVIAGSTPMDERDWDFIYIGNEVMLEKRAFCCRLVEEVFDKNNLEWKHKCEPLDDLRGAICFSCSFPTPEFGIYATVCREGKIYVGDPVSVVYKRGFLSSYPCW